MRTLNEIQPGMTLGRYELLLPIAEGGMATVWAARLKGTRGFSKTVAIKTMLPSISDDPQFEQMFLDEAQIAARIKHPNVVEILDLGEQDEVLYLVMEWVHGEPLASVRRAAARRGGIPKPIAVRIVADACAGLHAAHELKDEQGRSLGLVHRDISPQNILITFDGVVKIVDFGVAKAAGRTSQATTAGQVKGKPPYMSPEQALGEAIDRRTDVFALGIILYQLTTGMHPFRGESDLVTLQNIVSDKPIVPPRARDKTFPRRLEAVILKAIDRDPVRRYQSCAEFEAAFDEVYSDLPRARIEDVGRFMTEMLGHKGGERIRALKDALRFADERAVGRVPADPAAGGALDAISAERTNGGPAFSGATTLSGSDGNTAATPVDATVPSQSPPPAKSGRLLLAATVLAVAAGGTWLWSERNADWDPASKTPATAIERTATPTPAAQSTSAIVPSQSPAPVATPSGSAFVPDVEPVASARSGVPSRRTSGRAAAKTDKARTSSKTRTGDKSGFVPPPVSDPGF